jgi:hypothetical protein
VALPYLVNCKTRLPRDNQVTNAIAEVSSLATGKIDKAEQAGPCGAIYKNQKRRPFLGASVVRFNTSTSRMGGGAVFSYRALRDQRLSGEIIERWNRHFQAPRVTCGVDHPP